MNIAILTFEGFNELDSFIAAGILNRMKEFGWNVQITSPTQFVTSMNGVKIEAQQQLEFANNADVVLFGSGIFTRDIAKDKTILDRLSLNSNKQLICAQCSGTLILSVLGLLNDLPACTDLTTKPWVIESGINVLNQPFLQKKILQLRVDVWLPLIYQLGLLQNLLELKKLLVQYIMFLQLEKKKKM